MLFSKAIKIKLCVNELNAARKEFGYQPICFRCGMFSIGQWAVTLSAPDGGIFLSMESERIFTLIESGEFTFWIGCNTFAPVLYFQ